MQTRSGPLLAATGLRRRHWRGLIPSPGRPLGGPTVKNGRDPQSPRGKGADQKAFKLDGDGYLYETGMVVSHTALHESHVCLDKLGVLLELIGDAYGRSEGRTSFLAAAVTPPLRRGHMAPAERGVHPGGHGRERLRVERALNDRVHGDREGILLGVEGRAVLHLPGALVSLPVPAIHGAPM